MTSPGSASPASALPSILACAGGTIRWGVCLRAVPDGAVVAAAGETDVLPIASVGKVLLLVAVADALESGALDGGEVLERTPADAVADSGVWQHLVVDSLRVVDLAALVGAVSDNLATNVLLRRIGLGTVADLGVGLRLTATHLHDRVRDERGPGDPPTLATGTAAELSALVSDLAAGRAVDAAVSRRVLGWLAANADLSMVAGAFGLDPLAHVAPDRRLVLRNKTGTDAGVRADVGVVTGPGGGVAYAALATFDDDGGEGSDRDRVLEAMAGIGRIVRGLVSAPPSARHP